MIRKTFIAALAMAAASPAFAQGGADADATETVEYSNDKFTVGPTCVWSNWFIRAGGGANILFTDHDKQADFGDRLGGAVDVAVGKWFTPGIGVRFMYSGLRGRGATQGTDEWPQGPHTTGDYLGDDKGWTYKEKLNFYNFHIDAMFNLCNLFGGYKDRVYGCSPYVGLGVIKVTNSPKRTEVAGHFGILNTFRLCTALDLNLDLRGTLTGDELDGVTGGRGGEGMFTASLGLAYKFKPRGWDRSKTIVRTVYNREELDAMREKLNRMSAENARLQKALAENNQAEAKESVKRVAAANLIVFKIDRSDLSNQARANLGLMAEVIKESDPEAVYVITGYADAGTGSEDYNERLSKARAEAVYDCLVNEFGVKKSQLKIDYKGGVENMFYDDPRLSRAVIMRSE